MILSDLETQMRAKEIYHGLNVLPDAWIILRVDGRSFSKLTEKRFQKPFDERFSDIMRHVAERLVIEFDAVYGYTESDEVSIVLRPSFDLFNRKVEKLVSISAGLASAVFTFDYDEIVAFDSRVWVGTKIEDVVDYMSWRQADSARCCLNGYVYWTLRSTGMNARAADHTMLHMTKGLKHDLLMEHGINFNGLPLWQRRGVGVVWRDVPHTGFNPIMQEHVTVTRRRAEYDERLRRGDEYREWLGEILA